MILAYPNLRFRSRSLLSSWPVDDDLYSGGFSVRPQAVMTAGVNEAETEWVKKFQVRDEVSVISATPAILLSASALLGSKTSGAWGTRLRLNLLPHFTLRCRPLTRVTNPSESKIFQSIAEQFNAPKLRR
jgi:hypothetical protein